MTTTNTLIKKSDYAGYLEKGIGYNQYKQQMAKGLALSTDLKIKEYINLNQRRMHRVEKTYVPGAAIVEKLKALKHKTYWLVLTEHWCGDASQILPVFNTIAELSGGKIDMRLVYRDENPELMDAYLTNETRSIPKLVQLDEHFNVTAIWGPRPAIAQKLVKELKSYPPTAADYTTGLHLWYAKDKQQSLEKEISTLLFRASLFCPDCLS
jgi:hypothetical protein